MTIQMKTKILCLLILGVSVTFAEEREGNQISLPAPKSLSPVGPDTEKRFPPLEVPQGFRSTLFACDPLIEYPSVIAIGPRVGSLFVAHDYVTGLGVKIVRRDEIRFIEDTDDDGYADKSTVYAKDFNSIQGLAYSDGTVFVMHAPLLTALRDTNKDRVADKRHDLIQGLGLPPEQNDNRLHCANGVVVGHDGWLYLALGDRGCDVVRPEGDRLLFQQGGILRCRRDGRDLHVFASGLRNIYDIALDEELHVFVRDNENDGGDYMIRVCHSFFGADHGYPYDYYERPQQAVTPLADLGRGSSAGGLCYLETAFPPEYRGNLLFCEWGRAIVRYERKKTDTSFAPMQETDFAAGANDDPYGFHPTDVVVDWDGSLLVSDWADGQRPKRGRGRIYRIQNVARQGIGFQKTDGDRMGIDQLLVELDAPGYHARTLAQLALQRRGAKGISALRQAIEKRRIGVLGRLHAVWLFARQDGRKAIDDLFRIIETDSSPRVRAQAIRALADLVDPDLQGDRLGNGRGDPKIPERIAKSCSREAPCVTLEAVIAFGRLRWQKAPDWIATHCTQVDDVLAHAAMQTLRRVDNWPAVLNLLDQPSGTNELVNIHTIARRALADHANETIAEGLIRCLAQEPDTNRRSAYTGMLARIYKRPQPWTYWGFRPKPRPAHTEPWAKTEHIKQVLNDTLADKDFALRRVVLQQMMREKVPQQVEKLNSWLAEDTDQARLNLVLRSLQQSTASSVLEAIETFITNHSRTEANRSLALNMLIDRLRESDESRLLDIANRLDDGALLTRLIREFGTRSKISCDTFLIDKLHSHVPEVRAAAVQSLADRKVRDAEKPVVELLADKDVGVLRAAATAAGRLKIRQASERLLSLASHTNPIVRRNSLQSLRQIKSPRAVMAAVVALPHSVTQLSALDYLRDYGGPEHLEAILEVAESTRSVETLVAVVRVIARWESDRSIEPSLRRKMTESIARLHGESGVILQWRIVKPTVAADVDSIVTQISKGDAKLDLGHWPTRFADARDGQVNLPGRHDGETSNWFAVAQVIVEENTDVEWLVSGREIQTVWIDGGLIYQRGESNASSNSDRFDGKLNTGLNQVLVDLTRSKGQPKFQLSFRPKSKKEEHERLTQLVLRSQGDVNQGAKVFYSAEKSQCIKCHRMGDQGATIGPDLTGIGRRFSRVHLIESILDPSRTIAPSYGTISVELKNGKVLSGVLIAETETAFTFGDKQGKLSELMKQDVEQLHPQTQSTMPVELVKGLTDKEFLDLIEFLGAQR